MSDVREHPVEVPLTGGFTNAGLVALVGRHRAPPVAADEPEHARAARASRARGLRGRPALPRTRRARPRGALLHPRLRGHPALSRLGAHRGGARQCRRADAALPRRGGVVRRHRPPVAERPAAGLPGAARQPQRPEPRQRHLLRGTGGRADRLRPRRAWERGLGRGVRSAAMGAAARRARRAGGSSVAARSSACSCSSTPTGWPPATAPGSSTPWSTRTSGATTSCAALSTAATPPSRRCGTVAVSARAERTQRWLAAHDAEMRAALGV